MVMIVVISVAFHMIINGTATKLSESGMIMAADAISAGSNAITETTTTKDTTSQPQPATEEPSSEESTKKEAPRVTNDSLLPDKPNMANVTAEGVHKVTDSHVLVTGKEELRLSLVKPAGDGSNAYKRIMSLCASGSTIVYERDGGLGIDSDGITYAKVWCMHKIPNLPEVSLNEWLIHTNAAELDKESCNKSAFGNQHWAKRLGC